MEATAKDWLDSMSAGTCELNALLNGVTELLRRSPDEGWELLSIVDQYYRRGKINAAVFATLRAHLQGLLMGKSRPEVSVPVARSRSSAETRAAAATIVRATAPIPLLDDLAPEAAPGGATPGITAPSFAQAATAAPAAAASAAITVGSVLRNRYRVQGILGHGGTGTVFEAVDLYRLDAENGHEKVAIKVLHPNVIRRAPLFAELRREVQRLQLLSHPNIVRVHEFDRDGETAFFTMEHLSGVLLSRVIAVRESAPVSREHALAMLRDIADAIGYAHRRGVVHGDVSPGNIFICNDGELRVLDFGSSGVATPSFASCQVLEGEAPEARDDVYSLACIAYVLLAGAHPFQEQTALNARAMKLKAKRPSGLSAGQWQALRAGLKFDRKSRPANVAAWASSLNPRPPAHRLPALPTVMSAPDSRQASYRWPALAGFAIVVIAGGWWASTHIDSLRLAIAGSAPALQASPTAQTAPQPPVAEQTAATLIPAPIPAPIAAPIPAPIAAPMPSAAAAPPPVPRERVAEAPGAAAPTPPLRVASSALTAAPAASASPLPTAAAAGTPIAPTNPGSRARLELSADNVDAVPADGIARLAVKRTRSLRGDVSFSWWTESGTAKPGRDFAPIAPHVEQIEDGKSAVNLLIPIIADPQRRQARSFYVVIDEASPTAAVGPRTLAMVTIPEPD